MADAPDTFEKAVIAGAVRALRSRAKALSTEAETAITSIEAHGRTVVIVPSESRALLDVAADWSMIADELEGSQ